MNHEKQTSSKTSHEQKALENQVEQDHAYALKAAKIGKRLVGKTTQLIESGKEGKPFFSPTFARMHRSGDSKSVSLALKAELRKEGINAKASVIRDYTAKYVDYDEGVNIIELDEVEGVKVNNERRTTPKTSYEQKVLENQVEQDHAYALKAAKIGKRLVGKTTQLIESGKEAKPFISPTFARMFRSHDSTSVTLALNAELRKEDINAKAFVTRDYTGEYGNDDNGVNIIELDEVEGVKINH